AAAADPHLAGVDAPSAADVLRAQDGNGDDRRAGLECQPADTALRLAERSRPNAGTLGEDPDGAAAFQDQPGRLHRLLIRLPAANRKGTQREQDPCLPALVEELRFRDEVNRPAK